MNNKRRKEIETIVQRLNNIKDNLYDSKAGLNGILSDEEMYYDNIPENLQSSMRAIDSEDAISALEEAIDCIDSAIDELESIV